MSPNARPVPSETAHSPLTAFTFLAVAAVALSLRLVFIFNVSTIPLKWDAAGYWAAAQAARNSICARLHCAPGVVPAESPFQGFSRAIVSREGLLPLIMAPIVTILPNDPRTAYVLFAVGDALACLMLVDIVLRLGGPLWVGAFAGLLQAVYLPAIVGGAAFLQQPLIRFGLIWALWSYVLAFTAETKAGGWRGVSLGTIAMVVVGFTSVPTRPLMWVVPVTVILICAFDSGRRALAVAQATWFAAILGTLVVVSLVLALHWGMPVSVVWPRVLTGLSEIGTVAGQVTPLSFPHFWPPDDWRLLGLSSTRSLAGDLISAPLAFLQLSIYSLFSNWRYPDYLYFQTFMLTPDQQKVQHMLMVAGGVTGLAWLAGQPGSRQSTARLGLTMVVTLTVISSIISVEPRRLASLSPFLALGAACAVWSLAAFRHPSCDRRTVGGVVLLVVGVAMWVTPVSMLASTGFGRIEQLHAVWVLGRSAVLVALAIYITSAWRRHVSGFVRALPVAFVSAAVVCSIPAQLADTEWRHWAREIRGPVQQRVTGLRLEECLHPWLLVDVESSDRGSGLAISVNGRVVKAAGVPMYFWEAGVPPTWPPYSDVLNEIANVTPARRLWLAYPLLRNDLNEVTTIQLEPRGGTVLLSGDLVTPESDEYVGPLFDPWYTGRSLWRWIWNANDPRIPDRQPLHGARYVSADLANGVWTIRPASAPRMGLFRIFVTQAAFSVPGNALNDSSAEPVSGRASCGPYAAIATSGSATLSVCRAADGVVTYVSGDVVLGRSSAAVFQTRDAPNALVDRLATANGYIDVLQVLPSQFVANLYGMDGTLIYSAAFSTR